jgi:Cytochrome c oxidase subunit IIa family
MTNLRVSEEEPDAEPPSHALDEVPKGALALAGLAVVLLLIGWFFVYFFIFIPRGTVG